MELRKRITVLVPSELVYAFDPDHEHVFIAGAKLNEGKLVTSGGRVLGAVTVKPTLKEAIDASYGLVDKIHFDNAFYRRDIGKKALEKA